MVTLLFPADARDKANGLVGMVNGIGFVTTSAISGFLIAWGGMPLALGFGLALSFAALIHVRFVHLDEPPPSAKAGATTHVDLKGTILVVAAVPGLFALILLAAFNNFLGGVFMALLDAYGLSLMRVEAWGLLWALASCALILSGIVVARTGLGGNPVRTLLLVNLAMWIAGAVFTVQSSIPLLAAGCIVWLFLTPIAEAAEQTTLQKVVPFERQGRVFGFAQSVEQAAAPLTAFLIAPLAQFVFVPTMTDGAGAAAIGDWFGRGPERGIALVFTIAGALGVVATLVAFFSKPYRQLSTVYAER